MQLTMFRLLTFFIMGFLLKFFGLTFGQVIIITLLAAIISIISFYEGTNDK